MAASANVTYQLSDETGMGAEVCKIALERTKNNAAEAKLLLERWSGQTSALGKSKVFGVVCTYFEGDFDAAAVIEVQCNDELFSSSKEFYELVGEISQETVRYEHHYCTEPKLTELEAQHKCTFTVKSERFVKGGPLCLLTTYTHRDRMGVIVETEVENEEAFNNKLFKSFSFDLALHIAAFDPLAVTKEGISDQDRHETRLKIERELMRSGKPLNLWPTVTEGKLNKWSEQRSLLNQIFIKHDKDTVTDIKYKLGEKIGSAITIKRFKRFNLGT